MLHTCLPPKWVYLTIALVAALHFTFVGTNNVEPKISCMLTCQNYQFINLPFSY